MKIASIIGNLGSGGGRVLVDITRGFPDAQQAVFYGHPLGTFSFGLEKELSAAGIPHGFVPDQPALELQLRAFAPDVVLYHWWQGAQFNKPGNSPAYWLMINHNQLPMPAGYDFYVAISKANDLLQAHLPAGRRAMIYNGIDLARFPEYHKQPGPEFVIGRVSHLQPAKIADDYLEFLPTLAIPNWRKLIVGDGALRPALQRRAKELGIADRVEFAGEVQQDGIIPWLRLFDIACHLTAGHIEVFSIAILEQLATGIPVVTEPKGGLPEQIIHNENGFISPYRHDQRRYCELLYRHPELRARLSAGARCVAAQFSLDRQHAAYREVLARCR